ncbi:MAG: hypothetical protein ACK5RL_14315 [Acidimicrobiales bacterium]
MATSDPTAPTDPAGAADPVGRRHRTGNLVAVVSFPVPVDHPELRADLVSGLMARFRESDDVTVTGPDRGPTPTVHGPPGATVTARHLLTPRDGQRLAERVRLVVGGGVACGLAIGGPADDPAELEALAALARARAAPATVETAGPVDRAELARRRELVADLIGLFDGDPAGAVSFRLQPIVELATGRPAWLAVRPRWQHPRLRDMAVTRFVHLLDQAGVTATWTDLVVDRVRGWLAGPGAAAPPLLVPVPAGQLPRAVERRGAERRAGLPDRIGFEVGPGPDGSWHPADEAAAAAGGAAAVPLVPDGAGSSAPFPAQLLILDADLTAGLMAGDPDSPARPGVARALAAKVAVAPLAAADRPGDGPYRLLARGVQEPAEATVLSDLGIDLGQGFGLGRSVDADRWAPPTPG